VAGDAIAFASRTGRLVVAATVLGSAMASIDATVVSIALPSIGREFHVGAGSLQWVSNAYTLTLAGLLLLGGSLGDRFGRRRIFEIGTMWFALSSLLCAVAPDAPLLIATRALQGMGAALLVPGSLAILEASFRPADRARAIGSWSGLSGVATAVGPLIGGWLISTASWRLIFFINLPVAAAVLLLSQRHVPETRDPGATGRIDGAGAVLVTVGLAGLCYGLTEGPRAGWDSAGVTTTLVTGIAGLGLFIVVERRVAAPLLPLGLLSSRQFSGANAVTFAVYGGLGGALFLLPIQLEGSLRYTPMEAGLSLLPVTLIMLLLSARSGALAARIGPRLQMTGGPLAVGAGLALMSRIHPGSTYPGTVLPAVVVLGLGLAATVAPLTASVLAAAPSDRSSVASAVNNDVARIAGLVAVAVLPSAAGMTGAVYLEPLHLTSAFRHALLVAAATCVPGAAIALLTIRNQTAEEPLGPAQAAEEPCLHCGLDAPTLSGSVRR